MSSAFRLSALAVLGLSTTLAMPAFAAEGVEAVVDAAIEPVMEANDIAGLSLAVLVNGERHVFHYGVASRETGAPVDDDTIFEIGSLSKPFTGTLGALLAAEGRVNLSAEARSLMPDLGAGAIGDASLLDLATYTAGGLPLQFPDGVDETNFADWYRNFSATAETGRSRLYSNPSIGLFGHLAAVGAGEGFADLLQGTDSAFVLEPNVVEAVAAPVRDPAEVGTVSKTGSTGGFGAYALFSPERGTGIVILANRFWPNPARVETAHAILSKLDPEFFAR